MSKPLLTYHSNPNDAIRGKRVIIEAQRFDKPHEISKRTSRHGGNRVKADNAEAWVERAYTAGDEF